MLLFMHSPQQELDDSDLLLIRLSAPLQQAVELLEDAAAHSHPDAIFMLAEMNFHGNYSHPRNLPEAFRRYHDLATLNGNASAQHMIGFMYATGVGGAVEPDQAKAMLYHALAAEGGDVRSEMTMGYRYSTGIATPRNCDEAVHYYKKVADKAIEYVRSGPPGGNVLSHNAYSIADEEGGVFGEGASVSSAGNNAKYPGAYLEMHSSLDDVVEYMDMLARKGDAPSIFQLAKWHYDGSRGSKRDFAAARRRFLELARMYWTKDGKVKPNVPHVTSKLASKAAGYLGRMSLRGEGTRQSYSAAYTWFRRGLANNDALSQHSLGLMSLDGLGMPEDAVRAAEFFAAAADQDFAPAQLCMGQLFLDQGDVQTALRYFDLAARHGHPEAYYFLAEFSDQGIGRDKSCPVAAAYYKIVAERAEVLLAPFQEANEAYVRGDLKTAFLDYNMAAEQGFQHAQANVAYLVDVAKPRFTLRSMLPWGKKKPTLAANAAVALVYWARSAEQKNVDSMVKVGDYYFEGVGTTPDRGKAAACYQAAAETFQSAQAMWNLGWMHENGIGMEQDFHLSKRFYDQALETNPREAQLAVALALYKLRLRSWWNTVTNGKVKSIGEEEPRESRISWSWCVADDCEGLSLDRAFSNWLATLVEADFFWQDYMDGGDDEALALDDDLYDVEVDFNVVETLVILGLVATLCLLLYYRHRQQQQQQQRERQQQDTRRAEQDQQPDTQPDTEPQPPPHAPPQQPPQQPLQQQGDGDRGNAHFVEWAAGGVAL